MKNILKIKDRNLLKHLPKKPEELFPAMYEAYLMASRGGKRRTKDQHDFEKDLGNNLMRLCEDVLAQKYQTSPGIAFIVKKPVIREVFAASFRDRIVHHFLYGTVAGWWEDQYIFDSYSCRPQKGTLLGAKRIQKMIRSASNSGKEEIVIFKGDLKGYFMSLSREKLYEDIVKGLNRQFPRGGWLYRIAKRLWKVVIFDDPTKKVRRVGKLSDWDPLPKSKSLFCQPKGVGIVIGNLTSQLLSNIYLNKFDQFMKRELKFRWYGRYVDDFIIIVRLKDAEYVREMLRTKIPAKLKEMGLTLHPDKTCERRGKSGVPFLGFHVYGSHMLVGKRVKGHLYEAARLVEAGVKDEETLVSLLGMVKHAAGKNLCVDVFDSVGWVYKR